MFAYCGNNPVMRVDETGDWWLVAIAIAAVAIVAKVVISAVNYYNNTQAESNPSAVDTQNTPIERQSDPDFSEHYDYGVLDAGENGCEVIAVHNVKVEKGIDSSFADTALQFQAVGGMWLFGLLGSYPHSIGMVLAINGIDFSMVSANEVTNVGTYIVVYWSGFARIHTIMINNGKTENCKYQQYTNDIKNNFISAYKIN